jgi:hypothetical protein
MEAHGCHQWSKHKFLRRALLVETPSHTPHKMERGLVGTTEPEKRESLYVPWSFHRPSIHFITEPKDSFQPLLPLFPLFLRILNSLFRFGLFFDSWPILRQRHALQTFWLNPHPSSPQQPSAQQKFQTTLTPLVGQGIH